MKNLTLQRDGVNPQVKRDLENILNWIEIIRNSCKIFFLLFIRLLKIYHTLNIIMKQIKLNAIGRDIETNTNF